MGDGPSHLPGTRRNQSEGWWDWRTDGSEGQRAGEGGGGTEGAEGAGQGRGGEVEEEGVGAAFSLQPPTRMINTLGVYLSRNMSAF